ncbi:efflux RND transporter periplasmic adaptor subunit [Candidatus Sumerlaeota bacterium]|nr:efflux RND transporter periplasmic adaptor subunit [Candidatus Sumerlaeota bacterium]
MSRASKSGARAGRLWSRLGPVALVVCASACAALIWATKPDHTGEEERTPPALLEITTARVSPSPVPQSVEVSGFLRPHRSVDLVLEESGRVELKPFEAGADVASGELLLALETDMISAQLAQSEADLESARRALGLARQQVERARALRDDNAVSEDELDQRESAFLVAEALVESRRAARDMQVVHLDRHRLVAPMDGALTSLDVEVGSHVTAGQTVGRLDAVDMLEIDLSVAPEVRTRLRLGDPVTVWPDISRASSHTGVISRLDEVADSLTRKFEVEVRVDNADGSLLAGSPVRCRLTLGDQREAILIPMEWSTQLYTERCVYRIVSEEAEAALIALTPIETIPVREAPGLLEVVSGLASGDEIVTERLQDLSDGQEIVPLRPTHTATQGG